MRQIVGRPERSLLEAISCRCFLMPMVHIHDPSIPAAYNQLNVYHNWMAGITILSSSRVVVEDSDVWQNIRARKDAGIIGGSALVFIATSDSVAQRNEVYQNYGEVAVAGRNSVNITLEDNIIWDNKHANLYLLNTQNALAQRNLVYCTNDREFWRTPKGAPSAGNGLILQDEIFETAPDTPVSNGRIVINNIVVGCGLNFAIFSQQTEGGVKNAIIANNTFVEAQGKPGSEYANMVVGAGMHENTLIANNIVIQTMGTIVRGASASSPGIRFSHILYTHSVPSEFSSPDDVIVQTLY